ncbi:MAG: hypothetical protein JWO80_2889 [Bryobacterales bacterium]|nr:hypothetical protein [Bryobacterales bacterium]
MLRMTCYHLASAMLQLDRVRRSQSRFTIPVSGVLLLTLCSICTTAAQAQAAGVVADMVKNEVAARSRHPHFSYLSEERSTRTGGHLWKENVIETDDGQLRHLISVDGSSLSVAAAEAEERRLSSLIDHIGQLRKVNKNRTDDESRAIQLLKLLPEAFLLSPAGESQGCLRFAFQPNPAFVPSTNEERIVSAMQGTISIKEPVNRLCSIEARITHPVPLGLGVLARVDKGGYVSIVCEPVNANDWQITHISLHLGGRILMMKGLSRKMEAQSSNFHLVPQHQSLAQAAELIRP